MAIINYLASTFFKQPPIFLGLVALIGLLVQGKSFSDCLKGTVKTIMGTAILFKAVNLLADSVSPLSNAFAKLYQLPVENVFDPNAAWNLLGEYGTTIGIVLVASFVINLVVARFTPIKNIFLTGHIYFWMSYLFVGAGVQAGLSGTTLLIFAILFLSIYIIVTPALMRPLVKKLTGQDSFTIGHTATMYCLIGAGVGRLFKDKSKSTEDMQLPSYLEFLRDTTITTAIVMAIIYVVTGLLIGNESATAIFGSAGGIYAVGGATYDLFTFSIMAGITFGGSLAILLMGVRMMIGEIVPAFKGISDKLIPNAIPALDIPMVFPYAPNALMIGFVVSMVTSIATIVILASTGNLQYAVIPLVIACFFDIAPGAIFANKEGGRLAVVVTSVLSGVIMVFLIIGSIALFKETTAGFNQLYGGNGFSLWSLISYWFGQLFG